MTVHDPEVLSELRDEPELLAIADALAGVLPARTRARRHSRSWVVAAAVVAVVTGAAVAGVLVLLPTAGVRPSLTDRALAAVGDEPVLHAVLRQAAPSRTTLVELATGREERLPRVVETEIWFDRERALEHTITRATGERTQDVLSTPEGVTSESGPVWTCARIAAHPVEATRAGVSCNFSGDNGTTPRDVPEAPPTVDPALVGFVDGYRQALASGAARRIGEGTVDGKQAYWLELRLEDRYAGPDEPPADLRERVAVDADTYRPVVVRPLVNGVAGTDYEVLEIGTVARADADFSPPELIPPEERPSGTSVRRVGELDFAGASELLGARLVWAGPEVDGLKLAAIQHVEITTGYGSDSGVPPRTTEAVELVYGGVERRHPTEGSLVLTESTAPFSIWSLVPSSRPPDGYLAWQFVAGHVRAGTVNVELNRYPFSSGVDPTLVAAARQLEPVAEAP